MKSSINSKKLNFGGVLKGVLSSVFSTLISILIFAFILNIFNLGNESINVINQIIKIISILIGCIILSKSSKNKNVLS